MTSVLGTKFLFSSFLSIIFFLFSDCFIGRSHSIGSCAVAAWAMGTVLTWQPAINEKER